MDRCSPATGLSQFFFSLRFYPFLLSSRSVCFSIGFVSPISLFFFFFWVLCGFVLCLGSSLHSVDCGVTYTRASGFIKYFIVSIPVPASIFLLFFRPPCSPFPSPCRNASVLHCFTLQLHHHRFIAYILSSYCASFILIIPLHSFSTCFSA